MFRQMIHCIPCTVTWVHATGDWLVLWYSSCHRESLINATNHWRWSCTHVKHKKRLECQKSAKCYKDWGTDGRRGKSTTWTRGIPLCHVCGYRHSSLLGDFSHQLSASALARSCHPWSYVPPGSGLPHPKRTRCCLNQFQLQTLSTLPSEQSWQREAQMRRDYSGGAERAVKSNHPWKGCACSSVGGSQCSQYSRGIPEQLIEQLIEQLEVSDSVGSGTGCATSRFPCLSIDCSPPYCQCGME